MKWIFFLVFGHVNAVDLMTIVRRRILGLSDGKPRKDPEGMLVIGAGFGRTGTESLCAALTKLGYFTYHGTKAVRYGHLPSWNSFFQHGSENILNTIAFEGFNASTDFPASLAFETFMHRDPTSKIVLSVHPRGSHGWAASFSSTIVPLGRVLKRPPFCYLRPFKEYSLLANHVRQMIGLEIDTNGDPELPSLVDAYERWVAHVTTVVPQQRLLVHAATDGYAPLCAFLDRPLPSEAYPKVNDSEDLKRQILVLEGVADWWPLIFACSIFMSLAACGLCFCKFKEIRHAATLPRGLKMD
jgi:hypothetical protein